jgi:hypothetical protein
MVPSLGAPRPVHLCGPPGDRGNSLAVQPQVELVEASSSLANIMALLHTRQLTGGWCEGVRMCVREVGDGGGTCSASSMVIWSWRE